MECVADKSKKKDGTEDSVTESRKSKSSGSRSSSVNTCAAKLGWPIGKALVTDKCVKTDGFEEESKPNSHAKSGADDESLLKKESSKFSEMEMMKERFAKLLLGEDMSGSGQGVCPALAISNAITNLCATVFGQLWRLEPIPREKKTMWKREMECLLSVSDHIVEMIPSWQTFPDGKKLEVMTCRPRSDLLLNLPALRKLDNMLLDMLDCFTNTEFWYTDQGVSAPEADGSASFQKIVQRQEEKWWLPVPRLPTGGFPDESRKHLTSKRECGSQILKAAMSINSIALAEMEIPETYFKTLPKNGRACLGDVIYRYITSEHFSSECLLACLDMSSEHCILEIANRVEASIYVWRRRLHSKTVTHPTPSATKSSWEIVKDLMVDGDKREIFAERAESLLLCLKQRFPGLAQTTLDAMKIQFNKDVGKSILESYSRVLECLAFSTVARIDDLLYVDDLTKQSDKLSSVPRVSVISHKKVSIPYSVPVSGTPCRTSFGTPSFSPALVSPARGQDGTPFLGGNCNRPPRRSMGVKRVLTSYLGGEVKVKTTTATCGNVLEGGLDFGSSRYTDGIAPSHLSMEQKDHCSIRTELKSLQIDR